jgi:hypothetical protein
MVTHPGTHQDGGDGRLALPQWLLRFFGKNEKIGFAPQDHEFLARAVKQQGIAEAEGQISQVGTEYLTPPGESHDVEAVLFTKVKLDQALSYQGGAG